ncbi:MAG: glycosyltransferase family 39 protein, partial [Elusimicrobia bacterium]|nr:glycosyltransferase family 39 protein [Elusimicrobiota bacterium]
RNPASLCGSPDEVGRAGTGPVVRVNPAADRRWPSAAALFGGALLLRLTALVVLRRVLGAGYEGYYDDGIYVDLARAWAGLPGAADGLAHPPGYPVFLAPFCLLGAHGQAAALAAQCVLSAALAPLTFLLALRLGLSRRASLWGGVFCALNPMLIYFSTRVMTEILFVFLVMVFFLLWIRAWQEAALPLAAAAGLAAGLGSLTRGTLLPFGGLLAAAAFCRRKQRPEWLALVAVCGLVWALTMAPWTIRNAARYHRFVPVSVQGGWNFYEGLTADLAEIERGRPAAMGEEAAALGLRDPFAADAYFGAKARAWVAGHPGEFLILAARKAARFWRPWLYPPHARLARWAAGIFYGLFFGLVLIGLLRGAGRQPDWIFIYAWCLHLTLLHSVFASNLRYRLPLEPLAAILAGAGWTFLWRRSRPEPDCAP